MDSSPAPSASRKRSRTKDVLPDPAGPVKSRIGLQCSAGPSRQGWRGRLRDLKVAILQIPKKCAEICAYRYARRIPQPECGRR